MPISSSEAPMYRNDDTWCKAQVKSPCSGVGRLSKVISSSLYAHNVEYVRNPRFWVREGSVITMQLRPTCTMVGCGRRRHLPLMCTESERLTFLFRRDRSPTGRTRTLCVPVATTGTGLLPLVHLTECRRQSSWDSGSLMDCGRPITSNRCPE